MMVRLCVCAVSNSFAYNFVVIIVVIVRTLEYFTFVFTHTHTLICCKNFTLEILYDSEKEAKREFILSKNDFDLMGIDLEMSENQVSILDKSSKSTLPKTLPAMVTKANSKSNKYGARGFQILNIYVAFAKTVVEESDKNKHIHFQEKNEKYFWYIYLFCCCYCCGAVFLSF